MRVKDDLKQQALIEATVKVVNDIGFAASSVSKIAKEAGVSPATLYIYHKNKEDLLLSTFIEIKRNFAEAVTKDHDETLPVRDSLRQFWFNIFQYTLDYPERFYYTEQFSHSPYNSLVDKKQLEEFFTPLNLVVLRGIGQKIIKNVEADILAAFFFYPAMALANKRLYLDFQPTEENIEAAFNLSWDAVRF